MFRFYETQTITEFYRKYRPCYTQEIVKYVLEKGNKKTDCLVDVGCGGGQCAIKFSPFFKRVSAFDPSVEQLNFAKLDNPFEHVTFAQGVGEHIDVDDVTADVITVGEAVHWIDRSKFYK
ncbi:putative methyltransferase DDB_G0268948 [Ciona intestinalis]